MYCLWWLLVFVNLSRASWVDDFINGKSVEVGNDVSVSFKELPNADNASYLSSHALRIDLLGIGISFSKAPGTDAFNVGFYLDDDRNEQARGKRDKHIAKVLLPLVVGYKAATLLMGALIIVSGILLKSILAAKIALLVTGSIMLKKLFDGKSEESHKIHLFPVYEEIHPYSHTHKASDFVGPSSYHGSYSHDDGNYELSESNISAQYVGAPNLPSGSPGNASATPTLKASEIKRKYTPQKKATAPITPTLTKPLFTIHRHTKT